MANKLIRRDPDSPCHHGDLSHRRALTGTRYGRPTGSLQRQGRPPDTVQSRALGQRRARRVAGAARRLGLECSPRGISRPTSAATGVTDSSGHGLHGSTVNTPDATASPTTPGPGGQQVALDRRPRAVRGDPLPRRRPRRRPLGSLRLSCGCRRAEVWYLRRAPHCRTGGGVHPVLRPPRGRVGRRRRSPF